MDHPVSLGLTHQRDPGYTLSVQMAIRLSIDYNSKSLPGLNLRERGIEYQTFTRGESILNLLSLVVNGRTTEPPKRQTTPDSKPMKQFLFCIAVILAFPRILARAADTNLVERLAEARNMDPQEALKNYHQLLARNMLDEPKALKAVEQLDKAGAYDIIAVALPESAESIKPTIIETLGRADKMNPRVVVALLEELEKRNYIMRQGGEDLAGHRMLKQKLLNIISKLTGASVEGIDSESTAQVAAFIEKIRSLPHYTAPLK